MLALHSRLCFCLWSALWVWNKLSKLTHGHYTGRSASIVLLLRELSMFVVMLLLASFHTAKVSIIADMDTDKHTLEDSCHCEWHSVQRNIDWWEKKHINSNSAPNTLQHFTVFVCVGMSKCISVISFHLKVRNKQYNIHKMWRKGESEQVRQNEHNRQKVRQTTWMNQKAHGGAETSTNAKIFSFLQSQSLDWFMCPIICLLGLISWQNSMGEQRCIADCQLGIHKGLISHQPEWSMKAMV